MFLLLLSRLPFRSADQYLFSFSANDPAALATREIELLAFWDAVPVQFKQTTNASSIIKQQANILHARTLNATILLHRPALLASVSQTDPAPLKRESVLSAVSRSRSVLSLPSPDTTGTDSAILALHSSGSCVKAAVELLTHVSGTWSTTCHGNWWSSVGYEYSACLVVLACESCSSGFRLLFLWIESDPQALLFPDQISQRIRGKDAAAFLDPPVLDHQASAAVTAGLNTLHGLSHVNQGLSSEDLRASPDMIQAAGRSYSIISRLRDVLLNSYNATPMSDLPLFGSSWDLAAAAYPSIPDDPFRSTWEGDDTFVNDILQSEWWGTCSSVRHPRRLSDSTSSLLAQCSDLSSSSSTPLQPSSARSYVVLALVSFSNRPRRLILEARDAVGEVGGGRGHSLMRATDSTTSDHQVVSIFSPFSSPLTTSDSFQSTALATSQASPSNLFSPMVPSLEAPPPPFQPSDCSFRRELEHGPPLHFFSDPRAEEQDIETHPSPDEETVVGTPTPSWIEGADGEKQEVIFVRTAAAPVARPS